MTEIAPHSPASLLPAGYDEFIAGLKQRVRQAQLRAALSVNRELVLLYGVLAARFWKNNKKAAGVPESLTGWPPTSSGSFPR